MADPFGAATQDVQARNRALLEAAAAKGQAGIAEYRQAEAAQNAQKAAAISELLTGASHRGAPGTAQQLLSQTAGAPYDRGAANLAQSRESYDMLNKAESHANDLYMQQAAGAIPLVHAVAEEKRKAAEQKAALAGQTAAAKQAAQATPIKQASTYFGGVGGLRNYLAGQGNDNIDIQKADRYVYGRGANGPGSAPATDSSIKRQGAITAGGMLGLSPEQSAALAPTERTPHGRAEFNRQIGTYSQAHPSNKAVPLLNRIVAGFTDDQGTVRAARSVAEAITRLDAEQKTGSLRGLDRAWFEQMIQLYFGG